MNARDRILAAVRAAKPDDLPPPRLSVNIQRFDDPVEYFAGMAERCAATVVRVENDQAMRGDFASRFPDAGRTWSILDPGPAGDDPHAYADLDVLLARAAFGVAENAALWMDPPGHPAHAALVLCQHLAIAVNAPDIVPTMHEAYARLDEGAMPPTGLFIAGPSKTADIEQALVLGAHGARSLTVYLVG